MRRFVLLLPLLAALAAVTARSAQAFDDSQVCGAETARQERLQNIPDRLLHAISLVESGRWDENRRVSFAWPWTIMAEGEGRFLPSKAEAIAEVRKLKARGVKNIDVGCMQINLQAHPDAFRDLDEAFDPATNVAYAARFLTGLYGSTGDWTTAGAYYHSQTPSLAADYKSKLVTTWNNQRKRSDTRLQMAALDNHPPLGLGPMAAPPRPTALSSTDHVVRHLAEARTEAQARTAAERAEAKRIADAYRQARLAEYMLRRQQTQNKS